MTSAWRLWPAGSLSRALNSWGAALASGEHQEIVHTFMHAEYNIFMSIGPILHRSEHRYADFQGLKPLLQRELQYTDSILVLTGPQASTLHEDLHDRSATWCHSDMHAAGSVRSLATASTLQDTATAVGLQSPCKHSSEQLASTPVTAPRLHTVYCIQQQTEGAWINMVYVHLGVPSLCPFCVLTQHCAAVLCCSGYRGVTAVHSSSTLIQAWRQKYADNNKSTMNCQVADIAEGLAFDHRPYNAVIDKVCWQAA